MFVNDHNKQFDSTPVSEGMQYGPFPPPELDANPISAAWIMESVGGNMEAYQIRMLQESLLEDKVSHRIDPRVYLENRDRLDAVWRLRIIAKPAIKKIMKETPIVGLHSIRRHSE